MMNKLIVLLLLCCPLIVDAQFFEVGASIGSSNYRGELSSNSSTIDFKETNLSAGALVRYNINHLFAVRLHGRFTTLSGDDAQSDVELIQDRNLNFETNIYEVGLTGEINLLGFDPQAGSISPYLFAGYTYFQFNPQTELDGRVIDLQELGTEGQGLAEYPDRTPYELSQWAIPFGLGFKYALSENIHIGLEIGARKLFTDYLDDVSLTYPNLQFFDLDDPGNVAAQLSDRSISPGEKTGFGRGDTNSNDWYFITNFTVTYNFLDTGTIGGRRSGRRSKVGCPTF